MDTNLRRHILSFFVGHPPVHADNEDHRERIHQAMDDALQGKDGARIHESVDTCFGMLPEDKRRQIEDLLHTDPNHNYLLLLGDKTKTFQNSKKRVTTLKGLEAIKAALDKNPEAAGLLDFGLLKGGAIEGVSSLVDEYILIAKFSRFSDAFRDDQGQPGRTPDLQTKVALFMWDEALKPDGMQMRSASRSLARFFFLLGLDSTENGKVESLFQLIQRHDQRQR